MLTWVDIVLLAILGLSALVGLWRGFVVEVMSLAVWVAAFWLAFAFGDNVAALFEQAVQSPSARLFLGYAVLFIGALIVGGLATWLMGKLVQSTGLSGTDRLLGLGFGLLRGAALCCVLVLLFGFQGRQIVDQPLIIALLAVPILIQVYLNAGVSYWRNRKFGVAHCGAGPSALIGASNFFELAVATAVGVFGVHSGAALATVVGVLVEVPVMLSVVRIVNASKPWYERRA